MLKKIFKSKWLVRSIGIILFILILLFKIDFRQLRGLVRFNPVYFGGAIILTIVLSFVRPIRWQYILKKSGIYYRFWTVFKIYNIGVFMGNITPGKLGEFGKIVYLKKDNHPINKSLVSIIVDKLSDLFLLSIIGFFGLLFLRRLLDINILPVAAVIVIAIFSSAIIIKSRAHKPLLKKIFSFIVPKKFQESWQKQIDGFVRELKLYGIKNYFYIFFITTLFWAIHYLMTYLLAKSIGINQIPFLHLVFLIAVAELVMLIPISVLGIGTRNISLLFLFSLYGVPAELTIGFSLLVLLIIIINSFIGLLCWFKKPITISSNSN